MCVCVWSKHAIHQMFWALWIVRVPVRAFCQLFKKMFAKKYLHFVCVVLFTCRTCGIKWPPNYWRSFNTVSGYTYRVTQLYLYLNHVRPAISQSLYWQLHRFTSHNRTLDVQPIPNHYTTCAIPACHIQPLALHCADWAIHFYLL